MKTQEEIQEILNRTLEFIIEKAETEEDLKMIYSTKKDYEDMGYPMKSVEDKYKEKLSRLLCMLHFQDQEKNDWYFRGV